MALGPQNGDLMLLCANSEGFGKSAQPYLSLHHCTKISCAASNGDLCAIHASSIDSGESAHA